MLITYATLTFSMMFMLIMMNMRTIYSLLPGVIEVLITQFAFVISYTCLMLPDHHLHLVYTMKQT